MKFPLNRGGGKGDRPRPMDKQAYDEYFKRTGDDYCRFPHTHDEECIVQCLDCKGRKNIFTAIDPISEDQEPGGISLQSRLCKACNGTGRVRGLKK